MNTEAKKEMRETIMKAETSNNLCSILEQAFSSHRVVKKTNRRGGNKI